MDHGHIATATEANEYTDAGDFAIELRLSGAITGHPDPTQSPRIDTIEFLDRQEREF
jgi:hypothetical protein